MLINNKVLKNLINESRNSLRKRSHLLLHDEVTDDIQSLLFALQPDTEISIHRHPNPTETICCLKGNMAVIIFDNQGEVTKVYSLNSMQPILKFSPAQWHSYVCLTDDTIGWEIKEGPYISSDFESPEWIGRYMEIDIKKVVKEWIKD
jgi:cupin fold WbuC family metalloprotein